MLRLLTLLLLLFVCGCAAAIEVPKAYQRFIHTNPENTKSWWRTMGERFDLQPRRSADINVALVIGVSQYEYLRPLTSTGNDAQELADYLLAEGGFEQVILLTEADATKQAIVWFMEDYIPALLQRHSDQSRFLFYFSGHGERRPGIDRGYLRLAKDREGSYSGSIGMDRIYAWANYNTRNAIHSLFLIDSCMSGIVGRETMGNDFDSYRRPEDLIRYQAGILITAGTEDQEGQAGAEWDGSLFNAVLLHGLQGAADQQPRDGVITSQELFAYIEGAVGNETGQRQTPRRFELRKFKSGDFFFLSPGSELIPPPPPPNGGDETMGGYRLETIDRQYRASVNSNVRRGPGTDFPAFQTLPKGRVVTVIGKVVGRDWYQIELADGTRGYTFARLLTPYEPTGVTPPIETEKVIHDSLRSGGSGPQMVRIPAGRFQMGSDSGEVDEKRCIG